MKKHPRNEELFRSFCRQTNTRCDRIMTAIERGATDTDIARAYRTDWRTIAVYRKALNNELSLGHEMLFTVDNKLMQRPPGRAFLPIIIDGLPDDPKAMMRVEQASACRQYLIQATGLTLYKLDRVMGLSGYTTSISLNRGWISARTVRLLGLKLGIDLVGAGFVEIPKTASARGFDGEDENRHEP